MKIGNGDTVLNQKSIEHGGVLVRILNAAGIRYSLIVANDTEMMSCETYKEDKMLKEWKKTGQTISR